MSATGGGPALPEGENFPPLSERKNLARLSSKKLLVLLVTKVQEEEIMDKQDEIFVVVDKNDKIIGYRTRYECHHNKQLIHRVTAVAVFNDQGQILLQKRSKNKDVNPGLYTLSVSGHVSKGESYKQAAQRELREELGIQSPLLTKKAKFITETDIETEMDCVFTATHNGPFFPNKYEVDEVKFVTIDKLKQIQAKLTPFAVINLKKLGFL